MKRIIFTLRAIYLLIFGAFIFLLVLFFLRRSSVESIETVEVAPTVRVSRAVGVRFPSVDFDSEAYYRPILEYNLFRPLGWTPPRPVEPYRLLGTLLPTDDSTPPKAILESTETGKKTYIVSVGDKIDALTVVVEIRAKSVVLSTDGEQRTLRKPAIVFLK